MSCDEIRGTEQIIAQLNHGNTHMQVLRLSTYFHSDWSHLAIGTQAAVETRIMALKSPRVSLQYLCDVTVV